MLLVLQSLANKQKNFYIHTKLYFKIMSRNITHLHVDRFYNNDTVNSFIKFIVKRIK